MMDLNRDDLLLDDTQLGTRSNLSSPAPATRHSGLLRGKDNIEHITRTCGVVELGYHGFKRLKMRSTQSRSCNLESAR